jgi:hypothetical protein
MRIRLGLAIGGAASLAVLAASLVDCAEPTQIVVEVYSDACPAPGRSKVINATGIAVGTASNIDQQRPAAYRSGCESASAVGSLTIYPSGDSDGEVALKVVGGVEKTPDRCDPPDYVGCIVHRRMMRFIPHTTQRAVVNLELACLDRTCPAGTTCSEGTCVSARDILADGGASDDAARSESGAAEGGAGVDAAADAGVDACAGCKGACDPTQGCVVDCSAVACSGELCAPTLPCKVLCPTTGACSDIRCSTSQRCAVDCSGQPRSCGRVACNAGDCAVTCAGPSTCNADGGILLDAGNTATLICAKENACGSASCNAGVTCTLTCDPAGGPKDACPSPRPCSAPANGCAGWR